MYAKRIGKLHKDIHNIVVGRETTTKPGFLVVIDAILLVKYCGIDVQVLPKCHVFLCTSIYFENWWPYFCYWRVETASCPSNK
jgi:hypothetical protein